MTSEELPWRKEDLGTGVWDDNLFDTELHPLLINHRALQLSDSNAEFDLGARISALEDNYTAGLTMDAAAWKRSQGTATYLVINDQVGGTEETGRTYMANVIASGNVSMFGMGLHP